jgi:hypothetical protein
MASPIHHVVLVTQSEDVTNGEVPLIFADSVTKES